MTPRRAQSGTMLLPTSLILLIAIGLISLSGARTAVLGQRMQTNELHAGVGLEAAESGLQYGLAWLSAHEAQWSDNGAGEWIAYPDPAPPDLVVNGEHISLDIRFTRHSSVHGLVHIRSRSLPATHAQFGAEISAWARIGTVLTTAAVHAPPLIVDGCIGSASTGADLYPDPTANMPMSILSSAPQSCSAVAALDLHGGVLVGDGFEPDDAWSQTFFVDRDDFRALDEAERAGALSEDERRYWWVRDTDLDAGAWRRSLGREDHPVIVVFPPELGCPHFDTAAQLIGLVYIDSACIDQAQWGDLRIDGSLVVAGDLDTLGPDVELNHFRLHWPLAERLPLPPWRADMVPGTWSDWP